VVLSSSQTAPPTMEMERQDSGPSKIGSKSNEESKTDYAQLAEAP